MEKINIEKLKTIINKELKEKNILYTNLFIHKVYLNHNIEIEKDSLSNIIKSNDNLVEVSQNIFMEKEFIKSNALNSEEAKKILNKQYLVLDFYDENIDELFLDDDHESDSTYLWQLLSADKNLEQILEHFDLSSTEKIDSQAKLLLSMDKNIKIQANKTYIYCQDNDDFLSNMFKSANKLDFIYKNIKLEELIYTFLKNSEKSLSTVEILYKVNIVKDCEKSKVDHILKESDRFIRTSYYEWTISENCNKEFEMSFEKAFSNLKTISDKKDRFEIIERYVLNEEQETLQDIGEDYGLTRERIRQIIKLTKRQFSSPANTEFIRPYSDILRSIIEEHVVISLDELENNEIYEEVFGGLDSRWTIGLFQWLNDKQNKYTVVYDKFIINYCENDYEKILSEFNKEFRNKKDINITSMDEIMKFFKNYKINNRSFINTFIENLKYTLYINKDEKVLIRRDSQIIKPDTIYYILDKLAEPAYYLETIEEYREITNDYEINERAFLAMFQRSEDLVRIHSGIFALKEWGMKKHIHTRDWNYRVLLEAGEPMHYKDIVEEVSQHSYSKEQTIYINLSEDQRIFGFKDGRYGLQEWLEDEDKMNELGIRESDLESRARGRRNVAMLIEGESENITLKTDLTPAMVDNGYLNLIRDIDYEFDENLYAFTHDNSPFPITYGKASNSLYRLKDTFEHMELKKYEIIYVEIMSKAAVRLLNERQYEDYRTFDKSTLKEVENRSVEVKLDVGTIECADDLRQFGLKYGYIKYKDIEEIMEQIDDVNDLLDELNDMGVSFV